MIDVSVAAVTVTDAVPGETPGIVADIVAAVTLALKAETSPWEPGALLTEATDGESELQVTAFVRSAVDKSL